MKRLQENLISAGTPLWLMLFLLLSCTLTFAQDRSGEERFWPGVNVSLAADYSRFDVGEINRTFSKSNIPEIDEWVVFPNASLLFLFTDSAPMIYTDLTFGGTVNTKEQNDIHVRYAVFNGEVNLNAAIFDRTSHSLYGALGFGTISYNVNVTDKRQVGNDFDQAFSGLSGNMSASSERNYYVNLRLNYSIPIDPIFSATIRAGYRIGLNKRPWEIGDQELAGSPETSAGGPYVGLGLTFH